MPKNDDTKIREQVDKLGRPSLEMLDKEITLQTRKEFSWRLARTIAISLIVAVAVVIIVTNVLTPVLQVNGSSMNPLLRANDIVLTVKTSTYAKNDVIAFDLNNTIYIKRVIALGGDTVDIGQDGTVLVNGKALNEPYATGKTLGERTIEFPYQVPTDTLFVLGDNRGITQDSRDSAFGTVKRGQIIGKVIFRLWPPLSIRSI